MATVELIVEYKVEVKVVVMKIPLADDDDEVGDDDVVLAEELGSVEVGPGEVDPVKLEPGVVEAVPLVSIVLLGPTAMLESDEVDAALLEDEDSDAIKS